MSTRQIFDRLIAVIMVALQLAPLGIILVGSYQLKTWTDHPGWLTDADTNCKYYTSRNFENRSIRWDGDCREGLLDGVGKLILYEGRMPLYQFEGTLKEGRIYGRGRLITLSDGDVYEGEFDGGQIQGFGHSFNDDGDHYEGDYLRGMRHGYGTYWYAPEDPIFKYTGGWKTNQRHGPGVLYYKEGAVVKGVFKEGELVSVTDETKSVDQGLPKNILITNDDGVEDMNRLVCLAEELSKVADQVVVAVSKENKSGTSNRMSVTNKGYLETRCLMVDTVKNISIYEVDGYPSDCIFLGAGGIFAEQGKEVDLVISGINGGANSGAEWFGSGTIGAARTAALGGIPAIAISGIHDEAGDPHNLQLLCKWVTDLTQTGIVNQIRPLEYLTVSIPEELEKVKGTKIVERAITFENAPFHLSRSSQSESEVGQTDIWKLTPASDPSTVYDMKKPHDVSYYYQNYIVIVPMSVDENNESWLAAYQSWEQLLPQLGQQ